MKKRFVISLLIVCVLLPTALSAALLDLSIGATAQYNQPLGQIKTDAEDEVLMDAFMDFENYSLGADVRLKVLLAQVDLVGKFSQETIGTEKYTKIETLATAGISMDLLGLARIGFGMGPNWIVRMNNDTGEFTIFDDNDDPVELDNLGDTFMNSPVAYRATLDFKLGKMRLGVNYTLDTEYTFEKPAEVDKLFTGKFDDGKFGVSLLFSLF
ncbi:MAG: hypothetical protein EOM15_02330 [Spirochaetia bacterium]|nr:hypothetical protein [Spirochaetia bacterium]